MNWQRIKIIILYSWFHLNHSMETWVDLIWFPLIEIGVFGLFTKTITTKPELLSIMILGLIMWEIVRVVQYSVSVGIMWDVWSHSFSSLFISPLTMTELIIGQTLAGLLKSFAIFLFLGVVSTIIFNFSIFVLGPVVILYILLLSFFSCICGIFTLSLIIRFGTDIQSLSWSMIYIIQPISAVIYPVSAMPGFMQPIAWLSPVTPVMEAARYQLQSNQVSWQLLGISLLGNFIYLALTWIFFSKMYSWSRRTGAFARLES